MSIYCSNFFLYCLYK